MENTSGVKKILTTWRNSRAVNMLAAMDAVFDYRIPVLHPLAVHFPLSLLLVSALAALVWMFRGTSFWRQCTAFLILLSVPTALVAYLTGDVMEERSEGVPIVDELVDLHEKMALYTLIAAGVAALAMSVMLAMSYRRGQLVRDPIVARVGVGLLIMLAAALVAWTAHIGATMTWGTSAL